ncbi:MAG: PrgI family protein [Acutalibacteraceae bacterium]
MEVKINREIRDYSEAVYFGLNLRQFVFSVLACGVAVGLYFLLKPFFGIETLSWVCILGAAPFAAIGFFQYHGMSAEKALIVYLKSEILTPKELKFVSKNYYDNMERSGDDYVRPDRRNQKENRTRRFARGRNDGSEIRSGRH